MEDKDVQKIIQEQALSCEEKFVLEKIYWQRTVRMIIVIITILMTLAGGIIAWGFNTSSDVTNNTQGRRDLERRMDVYERERGFIRENYENVAENQKRVLEYQERLSKKLDILIDRANRNR